MTWSPSKGYVGSLAFYAKFNDMSKKKKKTFLNHMMTWSLSSATQAKLGMPHKVQS